MVDTSRKRQNTGSVECRGWKEHRANGVRRCVQPRTNGKVERVIQTLLREWAYRFTYNSSAERMTWLARYLHFYNFHRAHSALAYNAPISRLDRKTVLRRNR